MICDIDDLPPEESRAHTDVSVADMFTRFSFRVLREHAHCGTWRDIALLELSRRAGLDA